jgi:hypothetical protein
LLIHCARLLVYGLAARLRGTRNLNDEQAQSTEN